MKKIYIFTAALLGGFSLHAQFNLPQVGAQKNRNEINSTFKKAYNANKVEGQLYWSNNFDGPTDQTDWVNSTDVGHTAGDWEIISALPSNVTSQQAQYQWPATFSASTGKFAFINSDVEGGSGIQNAYFTFNKSIDLSMANNAPLYLSFAEYYRNFNEQTSLEVSNDGGATWTIFEVNPVSEVPVNTNSVPGEIETVNISTAKGAGPWTNDVRIRFHYQGAWDWFWGIDNIEIVEAWNNDIKVTNWYQATDVTTTQGLDYYFLPPSQSSFPGLTFGAKVLNNGAFNQSAVALNVTGTASYAQTGPSIAINSNAMDSIAVTTPYIPSGLGMKTVNLTTLINPLAPVTDSEPSNNTTSFNMYVDNHYYSRDNDIPSGSIGQVSSQDGQALKIGNVMEIFDDMTVSEIRLRLGTQPAGAVGSEFFAEIYKYNSGTQEWDFLINTENSIVSGTSPVWVRLPLEGSSVALAAGDIVLVVAAHFGGTDEVRFALAQKTFEGTVLGFTADGNGFQLSDPSAVMIRLGEGTLNVKEISNDLGLSIYPNPAQNLATLSLELNQTSEVEINITDLSGKVVYNIALGTVQGTQNISLNTEKFNSGIYMVNTIIDGAVSTEKLVVKK